MDLSNRFWACALGFCFSLATAGCLPQRAPDDEPRRAPDDLSQTPPNNASERDPDELDCAPMDAFPDPEEIVLTPRADAEVEALALRCSQGFVADQDIYDRLAVDLAAIRAADPAMADIRDSGGGGFDSDLFWRAEDSATRDRLLNGEEPQYQCVLGALGATSEAWDAFPDEPWAKVSLEGRIDHEGLASVFESVPGIASADPNATFGDGDEIAYDIRSEPRRYLFERGGGDCPAGCTTHHYYLWEISQDQAPVLVGEWGNTEEAEFGAAPEGFAFDDFECRRCADGRNAQGEVEDCSDGLDNDCNGEVDCADTACGAAQVCVPEECANATDDDADGAVDCDDDDCAFHAACGTPTCGSPEDRAFIERDARGVVAFVLRDALACRSEETDPVDAEQATVECITSTFTNNGASYGCGQCFGAFGACAMSSCGDDCYPDYEQPACVACYESSCVPALETCLGESLAALQR